MLLYRSKVGPYTSEEFENAFQPFQATDKPRILVYFNDIEIALSSIDQQAMLSLWVFKAKLKELAGMGRNGAASGSPMKIPWPGIATLFQ